MQNRRESDRRLLPKEHSREKLYSRDDKLLVAGLFAWQPARTARMRGASIAVLLGVRTG
jgi:hypothetical protein